METIKVAICDDAKYLCEGFREELEYETDIEFVGEAYDSAGCVEMIRTSMPDILLLDIQMETERAGIEVIKEVLKISPKLKIIMLTSFDNEDNVFSAFANGAEDYFVKNYTNEGLVETIRNVYMNRSSLRPEIAKKLANKTKEVEEKQKSLLYIYNNMSKLSTSEFELLKALSNGETYNQIAVERFVEANTVRQMASRIIKKFEVENMNHLLKIMKDMKVFDMFS